MVWTLKPLWLSNGLVGVLGGPPKRTPDRRWIGCPHKSRRRVARRRPGAHSSVRRSCSWYSHRGRWGSNAGLRGPIAVIVLVVKWGHATLIVRRNHACAEDSGPVDERARNSFEAVVNQCHRIGLAQVLIGRKYTRAGWFDGSAERQDRVEAEYRLEAEPVGQVSFALGDIIVVERDMNVIRDAVVEAKGIRTDARVLERKNRNRRAQELLTKAILGEECIYVGGVGRGVQRYERRSMWLDAPAGTLAAMLRKKAAPRLRARRCVCDRVERCSVFDKLRVLFITINVLC